MPDTPLQHTPVILLVFNRPQKTQRIFEAVARARPPKLLVVADGPRATHADDARLCRETRAVVERIDWPCELLTHYAEANLGCKNRILSGLDWAFSQVPEAIVLEDDCLPDPSFFPYCEELLARYRHDRRVHMIRGGNFFGGNKPGSDSYHFSRWYHIWGWASWARAWRHTDHTMRGWPELRESDWLESRLPLPAMVKKAREIFDNAYAGRVTTWEYHFAFGGWSQDALAVCPAQNLVTNIGFGADAAHYQVDEHPHALIPTRPLRFPLRHPKQVAIAERIDRREWLLANPHLAPKGPLRRVGGYLRRRLAPRMAADKGKR